MTETIQFTAMACELAKTIYYGRALTQDVVARDWEALPYAARDFYIQEAAHILKAVKLLPATSSPLMDAFVGITRHHAAKVTHRITPQAPYGEEIQS